MKPLVRLAAALYPSGWRARYGAEFAALLEDTGAGWDFFDVLKGAIEMQITWWGFGKTALACGLAGMIVAAGVAWRMPSTYVSNAVIRARMADGSKTDFATVADRLRRVETQVLSRHSLAEVIDKEGLYKAERARRPMDDVVEDMRRRDIRIRVLDPVKTGNTPVFDVQFEYADPRVAQATTRWLVARLNEGYSAANDTPTAERLEVLDPPSLPEKPRSPNRLTITIAGLVLGLLLGAVSAGVRRWPAVALAGAGAAILSAAVSFVIPDQYVSQAVLRAPEGTAVPDAIYKTLANDAIPRNRNLSIKLLDHPGNSTPARQAFMIQLTASDRFKAQAAVRELIARLFSESPESHLEVLDPANLPQVPVSPNRLAIAIAGLFLGVALGAVIVWVRRRRTPAPQLNPV